MAGSRTLKLELLAVDKGFGRGLRNAESRTKRFGRNVGKGLKAAAVGAGALAAGAVVVGLKLRDAGEAAATSRARIENIADSMQLFGDGVGAVTDRLETLGDRQARATGINQNTIAEAQAIALTFREVARDADVVGGVFDRTNAAALDLAAAGFGSATDNAKQLGKALNDPATGMSALTRSGLTFTEAEKQRIIALQESNQLGEAQALILEAVEAQVGGTAEATANASDKMKVAFSQATEQLAERFMPTFDAATEWIAEKMPAALDWLEGKLDSLQKWWSTYGPAIKESVRQVASALSSWWTDTAAPAIRAIKDGLQRFWTETAKPVLDQLRQAWDDNRETIGALWSSVRRIFSAMGSLIGQVFSSAESDVQSNTDGMADSLGNVIRVLEAVVDNIADAIEWVDRWGTPLINAARWLGDLLSPLEAVRAGIEAVANVRGSLPSWLGGTGGGSSSSSSSSGWRRFVPGLAQGGIVTGPTLAMVGEGAESEAVLPLSRLEQLLDKRAGGGGGNVTINVTGTMLDPEGVARAVQRALDKSAARAGAFA